MEGRTVLRNLSEDTHDISAEGIGRLQIEMNLQRFIDVFQIGRAENDPFIIPDCFNRLRLRKLILFVKVSHQRLYQVVQGHDAGHAAILVQHDSIILSFLLHRIEKIGNLHVLGDKEGAIYCIFHHIRTTQVI